MDYGKQIRDAEAETDQAQTDMVAFSFALMSGMHLDSAQVHSARDHGIDWRIGNYNITPRSFPWHNWDTLLIATPATCAGDKAGYSNTGENNNMPASWTFIAKGTASIILPDTATRKEILGLL